MVQPSANDTKPPFPILVGDIGGTNARFALLVDAFAKPKQFSIVQTADFANIDVVLQKCILDTSSVEPRSAILALAGPIGGDEVPLTNCPWVVRPRDMIANLGFDDVLLVNDFEAQALAIASLGENDREKIGPGIERNAASRTVLGPGTGLGVAGLVYACHSWFPVPGEGGHVDVGPRSESATTRFGRSSSRSRAAYGGSDNTAHGDAELGGHEDNQYCLARMSAKNRLSSPRSTISLPLANRRKPTLMPSPGSTLPIYTTCCDAVVRAASPASGENRMMRSSMELILRQLRPPPAPSAAEKGTR